jgi:hypothetical protein
MKTTKFLTMKYSPCLFSPSFLVSNTSHLTSLSNSLNLLTFLSQNRYLKLGIKDFVQLVNKQVESKLSTICLHATIYIPSPIHISTFASIYPSIYVPLNVSMVMKIKSWRIARFFLPFCHDTIYYSEHVHCTAIHWSAHYSSTKMI